jgi:ATP-dependent DNA helicase RecG
VSLRNDLQHFLDGLFVLDLVRREQQVPEQFTGRIGSLLEHGALERVGRGRGTRHLLSRRFYRSVGKSGTYTRRRGLDRATNKELLLKHAASAGPAGAALAEFQEVLPGQSRNQMQTLLPELKRDGMIEVRGATRAARWFPAAKRNHPQ